MKIFGKSNKNNRKEQSAACTNNVYNLIILDESGSMISIYQPALTGMNETLQTIRMAQTEHPDQNHFVSLVAFDTGHYNQIYDCVSAKDAKDITSEQYSPCGGTPLYDAMGRAITELRSRLKPGDIVLVTVITDGYENASREYSGRAIKDLIESLKNKGWIFTYIGANQDVEAVANTMAIDNYMAFKADAASTKEMFQKEASARKKFFSKINSDIAPSELGKSYFDDIDETEK